MIALIKRVEGWFKNTSFKNRVLITLIGLSFAQAFFIGITVNVFDSDIMLKSEKKNLAQLIKIINEDVESRIGAYNDTALEIVISSEVNRNLNEKDPIKREQKKRTVNAALSSKYLSSDGILDITIVDINKNVYSTRAVLRFPDDFELESTKIFEYAKERNGGLVWVVENDILNEYEKNSYSNKKLSGIHSAALIKDYTTNKVKGLLMVTLKESYLGNISYSNEKFQAGCLYLVSPDKNMIYPLAGTAEELSPNILNHINFEDMDHTMNVIDETIVSYIKNDAMGWYLVSTTNISTIKKTLQKLLIIIESVLFLSIIGSIILARKLTRVLTYGLSELATTMKMVEKGNFDIQINSDRKDEIGYLSKVLDHMIRQIKELIISEYQQELMTKEAEFKALQAQINPHFLYNILDVLNWRLVEQGQEDLGKNIVALGDLLKYSIVKGDEKIFLSDELKNIEDYLCLQFSISDRGFKLHIEATDKEHILMPKLTLQPLVENAVTHGFSGRMNDNILTIRGYYEKPQLYYIDIADNGIGFDGECINSKESKQNKGKHIGIHNVRERIKIMYGEESDLIIRSQFGVGTLARIIIPMKGVQEDEYHNN